MKFLFLPLLGAAAVLAAGATASSANDRYAERPPVTVSPDLSAPWVIQLGREPGVIVRQTRQAPAAVRPQRRSVQPIDKVQVQPDRVRTAAVEAPARKLVARKQMNPIYLPQEVAYDGP